MISISREIAFESLLIWSDNYGDPHQIIDKQSPHDIKPEDTGFARELFFGTIKFSRQLDYYISFFQRTKELDCKLQQILRLAFYQLIHTPNIPEYAVISEAVELTHKHFSKKQPGFINAVLRNYTRNRKRVKLPDQKNLIEYLGIKYSYPDWLIDRYLNRYGFEHTEKLLDWCNQPPVLNFFINNYLSEDESVLVALSDLGIRVTANRIYENYYDCADPSKLIRSETFRQGNIIISDPAQSLSPRAMMPPEGSTVLDLFAAPGGKSAAIAGMIGSNGVVIAADNNIKRLKLMKSNLKRWRLDNIALICSNTLKFASSGKFQYILADVPCSGTGTIRRNPDLRWKLKPADIDRQANRQSQLIKTASEMLTVGGILVYSTCSIEPEENTEIISKFMKQNPDYSLKDVDALKNFEIKPGLYSVSPQRHQSDGAFVAVIERRSRK